MPSERTWVDEVDAGEYPRWLLAFAGRSAVDLFRARNAEGYDKTSYLKALCCDLANATVVEARKDDHAAYRVAVCEQVGAAFIKNDLPARAEALGLLLLEVMERNHSSKEK